MKRSDVILIAVVLIIAIISFFGFRQLTTDSAVVDGIANVFYNDQKILAIDLTNGNYKVYDEDRIIAIDYENKRYHVEGSNPYGVVIEYRDNRVRVIDEESPQHICQQQGWTNSPLNPLTCLPNNIIIVVESKDEDLPDDITG